jgi:hypothetical protein
MAYRTTQGHRRMSLGMGLLQGDTTCSSTHGAMLTKFNFETSHDQSMRKSDKTWIPDLPKGSDNYRFGWI